MPSKRRHLEEDDEDGKLQEIIDFVERLAPEGAANKRYKLLLALHIALGTTENDLKSMCTAVRGSKPSFSAAKWEEVAPRFDLQPGLDALQLRTFEYTRCFLPPSIHEEILRDATNWVDVYRSGGPQKESTRVRLMDAWFVPVLALFRGRLADKPENPLPATRYSSGGRVEHEVFMFCGAILFVIELKYTISDVDNLAQVLQELASAHEINLKRGFTTQPPVYAILTDLAIFEFSSYDGKSFLRLDPKSINIAPRPKFMNDMVEVSEVIFSLLLHAYIMMLKAVVEKSQERGSNSDHSSTSSFDKEGAFSRTPAGPRKSLGQWERVLAKAEDAQRALSISLLSTFIPPSASKPSYKEAEKQGKNGLALLAESVHQIPRYGDVEAREHEELLEDTTNLMNERYSFP